MDQKTQTGWTVAGVLAIAVILLAGILWYQAENKQPTMDEVLSEGYEEIALVRAEMQIKCQGPERNDTECEEALEELAAILREFSEDLSDASTTPPDTNGAM